MKNSKKTQTGNDQRSNTKNPNNPAHQKANDNRSVQIQKSKSPKRK